MIISNKSDLKNCFDLIKDNLALIGIKVKRHRILEFFSNAVVGKSYNGLLRCLPLYIELSTLEDADEEFSSFVLTYGIFENEDDRKNTYLFKNEISSLDFFPCIANHDEYIECRIDWQHRYISKPYKAHYPVNERRDSNEFYGNETTFFLGAQVDESSFNETLERVKPLLSIVKDGFEFVGDGQEPNLTETAIQAQEDIADIFSNYVDQIDQEVIRTAPEFFGEGFPWLEEVEERELTKIEFEGCELLDHKTSDEELREIVALELTLNDGIKDHFLYNDLVFYRDACKKNFQSNNK